MITLTKRSETPTVQEAKRYAVNLFRSWNYQAGDVAAINLHDGEPGALDVHFEAGDVVTVWAEPIGDTYRDIVGPVRLYGEC